MFGHRSMQPVIDAIISLAEAAASSRAIIRSRTSRRRWRRSRRASKPTFAPPTRSAQGRAPCRDQHRQGQGRCRDGRRGRGKYTPAVLSKLFKAAEQDIVRNATIDGHRIDGAHSTGAADPRRGLRPAAHARLGALHPRRDPGLVVTTLGTGDDEQMIDALEGRYDEHFMLHYNFPPYSVGETGRMGGPSRRDIGHGKLAWRAVRPMLPSKDSFPYTIRVVSEITESNGSSSMATVCGSSLAMMDAGVPAEAPDRRHRHGPHQGRRALRGALRHPG
jgi:polyribonucleotide nucleotidyltransferase